MKFTVVTLQVLFYFVECSSTHSQIAIDDRRYAENSPERSNVVIFTRDGYVPSYIPRNLYQVYPLKQYETVFNRPSTDSRKEQVFYDVSRPTGSGDTPVLSLPPNVALTHDGYPVAIPYDDSFRGSHSRHPNHASGVADGNTWHSSSFGTTKNLSPGIQVVTPDRQIVRQIVDGQPLNVVNPPIVQEILTDGHVNIPKGGSIYPGVPSNEVSYPYAFGYRTDDGVGNVQHREETSNEGVVTGSYGYRDNYGLYRIVNYVADGNGFHVKLKTNEPGTAPQNPADVSVHAEPPPYLASRIQTTKQEVRV